jgi:predicted nucleotide-binding protein
MPDDRKVFVVFGRSKRARNAMFEFLRALDLRPIEWSQAMHSVGRPSAHISEILDVAFNEAQAVVVILTGDDKGCLRKRFQRKGDPVYEIEETPQPRLNVVFEAGMALGRFPDRTILVHIGGFIRPFSDVAGRYIIEFAGSPGDRQVLKNQLELAGCNTTGAGTDWYTAGDFSRPVHED